MIDRLVALTCTGFRPEAFALCQRWMARQEPGKYELTWIVVEDGISERWAQEGQTSRVVIVPGAWVEPSSAGRPRVTVADNVLIGLTEACRFRPDAIVFFEDDDWYAPRYLRSMAAALARHEDIKLAGITTCRYYHVAQRAYLGRYSNAYSSLCRTAVARSAFSDLEDVARSCASMRSFSVDVELWKRFRYDEVAFLDDPGLCVSIKGLPGRPGAGRLHLQKFPNKDERWLKFYRWIGLDARYYQEVMAHESSCRDRSKPRRVHSSEGLRAFDQEKVS